MKQYRLVMLIFLIVVLLVTVSEASSTNGLRCTICKNYVKKFEKDIHGHGKGSLKKKAHKVCKSVSHNQAILEKLCKKLVDKSLDVIVKGIEHHYIPETTCKLVHLC